MVKRPWGFVTFIPLVVPMDDPATAKCAVAGGNGAVYKSFYTISHYYSDRGRT